MSAIPENVVVDFIDGTLRKKTPEEYVRQNVERSLVQEYKYSKENISVEQSIKVGSSRKSVDLAIYKDEAEKSQENIRIIVECKKEGTSPKDKKEGVDQLRSYMAACPNCDFGLWTNGSNERICLMRSEKNGTVVLTEVIDFPQKGQSTSEAERPKRDQLRPAASDNLLFAFRRCHNYISGNQGLQKPEAFWELLKVIFCKIEDERSTKEIEFYVLNTEKSSSDGQLRCLKRIEKLFSDVKKKFPLIFKAAEDLELSKEVLAYVVSQVQRYSLLDSPVDVKGVAYEEIVGSNLRGDRGEFFTPRNACRMAVEMLNPGPNDRIIDPSCGTGGFLVTAMNLALEKLETQKQNTWKNPSAPSQTELLEYYRAREELLRNNIVGLDLNPNLVRAAKMNMVMNNDGAGGLAQADSLRDPITWSDEARSVASLGSFDLVFTNPPFGTNIKIDLPDVLSQFELACTWDWDEALGKWSKRINRHGEPKRQSSQPPEILFIERCVQLLKPGTGRMAMVIPNGILNNPPLGYVRQWLMDNCQILAVIDMQRDLFQPRNDTQTSMVLVRRLTDDEKSKSRDYPVFFTVTDKIGHDKRGNPIFLRDQDGNDVIEEHELDVTVIVDGEEQLTTIRESVRVVDDQLPLVPSLFHEWREENGV
ncbi:N-6 DNA methylase [Rhodobacteraceae bacterium KMM 6894]|nr:N-6 DNA methylase [Rhodobacteraceae bacterium KMM 6894]